jgi:hypothetical protein
VPELAHVNDPILHSRTRFTSAKTPSNVTEVPPYTGPLHGRIDRVSIKGRSTTSIENKFDPDAFPSGPLRLTVVFPLLFTIDKHSTWLDERQSPTDMPSLTPNKQRP